MGFCVIEERIGKMEKKQLKTVQQYVANIAIGSSTLRNQGAPGVVNAAICFLGSLNLSNLKVERYPIRLNGWTKSLREKLPQNAKHWGTARKAINIFMVQAFHNKYLSKEYKLGKLRNVLETPIDKDAAEGLK